MVSEPKNDKGRRCMQFGLLGGAGGLFVAGIGLGFNGEPGSASVTHAAGVFCLIFAFLSRFKRFKGLGIEAELWEEKQEEAARLVESLRSLSAVMAEQLVGVTARMGRIKMGSATRKELSNLTERLDQILNDVGVPPYQREATKAEMYRVTAIDMAFPIKDAIDKAIAAKIEVQQKIANSFGSPVKDSKGHRQAIERREATRSQKLDWDRVILLAPNLSFYEAIDKTIEDAGCLNEDERTELRASIADEMEDLHEWVSKRRLRRPEQWFAGQAR